MIVYLSLVLSLFFFSILEMFIANKGYFKIIQQTYIIIIFLFFIFNRENNDYNTYLLVFDGTDGIIKEKGYLFLNILIKKLGGSYHIILLILGFLFIYVVFYLYKIKYKICFMFLYSIYIYIFDINQIRNLFCILFILIGIKFLQKNNQKFYLCFNILAILFQRLGYIYLIFFIFQKFKLKNYIKILILSFISGFFLIRVFEKIMFLFFPEKFFLYFSQKPNFGMLLYYILIIMDIYILKISKFKKIKQNESLMIKFILFPIIFLPYSSVVSLELINRIWRNALYIKWFYFLSRVKNRKNKAVIFFILALQQILLLSAFLYKDFYPTLKLLKQIANIKFYF